MSAIRRVNGIRMTDIRMPPRFVEVASGLEEFHEQDEDQKPFIARYVPLKAIADILGVPVKWDGENNALF
jgi:hypothetical protein